MFARILNAAIVAAAVGAVPAWSQGNSDDYVPAELPPDSFEGTQYVDSAGCAFIRAGFSGRVNWVPRFDEDRQPVCGLQPSLPGGTRVAADPAPAPPDPAPVTGPAAQAATPKAPAAQTRRVVAAPETAVRTPAPEPVRQRPARQVKVVRSSEDFCPNYDGVGQRAMAASPGVTVRCGAQRTHPVDGLRTDGPGGVVWQPQGGTRPMPEGYRPVWKDDRLNPNRGVGSPAGEAQMRRVWTETVPRELVNPNSPDAVPYAQPAARTTAHVSTRNPEPAAVQTRTPVASGNRYVQVGSFGVPSNAADTAARFENMGLPVRTTQIRSNGRTLRVVMIGPFDSSGQLQSALGAARRAGFGDAFIRG